MDGSHLASHPLFVRLSDEEMESDPAVFLFESTEEGQKVTRSGGQNGRPLQKSC